MILFAIIFTYLLYFVYLKIKKAASLYLFCISDHSSQSPRVCLPSKIIQIGLIIPVTSNKRNYTSIFDVDFIRILLPGFIEHANQSGMYIYNFYLGYDHDDQYYIDNREKILKFLRTNYPSFLTFSLLPIYDKKSKLSEIWTELAFYAVNAGNEFLYQLGDDIQFLDNNWEYYFIKQLEKLNNIGVVGPLDLNNVGLLTQSFVHKTHLDIFGYYYPKEIKNIYVDDWIQNVYQNIFHNRSFKFLNIRVKNSGGDYRYKVDKNAKKIYIQQLKIGKQTLSIKG
jgi:hypothetical protein